MEIEAWHNSADRCGWERSGSVVVTQHLVVAQTEHISA